MKRTAVILTIAVLLLCACIGISAVILSGVFLGQKNIAAQTEPTQPAAAATTNPRELTAQMDAIEAQVSAIRGRQPNAPLERNLMTSAELRAYLLAEFEEDYSPQEARDDARSLAALGLLEPEFDLYNFYLDLYAESILGFYDPEAAAIFVIRDAGLLDAVGRSSYAHEFQHALQDQTYGIEALGFSDEGWESDPERAAAIQALIEGEATLLEIQWIQAHFTSADFEDYFENAFADPDALIFQAPQWLQDDFFFPYEEGLSFVEQLYEQGGWAAVDAAYEQPPASTEMILHAEKFAAYERPVPVKTVTLTAILGSGWQEVDSSVLGEWFTYLVLREGVSDEQARAAAAGWGGNHYIVYYHEGRGETAMASLWIWDSPAEAEEFVDAFVNYGDERFATSHQSQGARICWSDEGVNCLLFTPTETLWLLAPDEETLAKIAGEFEGFDFGRLETGDLS